MGDSHVEGKSRQKDVSLRSTRAEGPGDDPLRVTATVVALKETTSAQQIHEGPDCSKIGQNIDAFVAEVSKDSATVQGTIETPAERNISFPTGVKDSTSTKAEELPANEAAESRPGSRTYAILSEMEVGQLTEEAKARKRNRLSFFNTDRMRTLRLSANGHFPEELKTMQWCVLCGGKKDGYRGKKASYRCAACAKPLCTRTPYKKRGGREKSCWVIWHSTHPLKIRTYNHPLARTSYLDASDEVTGTPGIHHTQGNNNSDCHAEDMTDNNTNPDAPEKNKLLSEAIEKHKEDNGASDINEKRLDLVEYMDNNDHHGIEVIAENDCNSNNKNIFEKINAIGDTNDCYDVTEGLEDTQNEPRSLQKAHGWTGDGNENNEVTENTEKSTDMIDTGKTDEKRGTVRPRPDDFDGIQPASKVSKSEPELLEPRTGK